MKDMLAVSQSTEKGSGDRGFVTRLLYGSEDTRLRATWRVCIPLIAGLVLYLAGQIVVPLGLRSFVGDVSGTSAVLWTLALLTLVAAVIAMSGLFALVVASRLDERPYANYGFNVSTRWGAEFLVGVLIGVSASIGAVLYPVARGYATLHIEPIGIGVDSMLLGGLVVIVMLLFFLANNVFEEILFRAIFIQNAAEGLRTRSIGKTASVVVALGASAPIFGMLHLLGNGGMADVLTSLVAGLLFATAFVLTGRMSLPIGVHFGGVAILTFLQEPVSQNPELTLPSVMVVDGIGSASLVQSVELWVVRATIGVILIAAWVYYSAGEIAIADEVYS